MLNAFAGVERDEAVAQAVVEALIETPPEVRPHLLARLEETRCATDTPVATAWRAVLAEPRLADVRPMILERVVACDPPAARFVLAELRNLAADDGARRDFQAALMRLGTRAIDRPAATAPSDGRAIVGGCDGQGAFIVLACLPQPDGRATIADLCIRAGADVRDGFVIVGTGDHEMEELHAALGRESGTGMAEAPLDEVAELVAQAVERTERIGRPLPPDALPAVLRFARLPRRKSIAAPPETRLAPPSLKETRKLLGRQMLDAWFLDRGDLAGAGIELPSARKPSEAWTSAALAKLAASEVRSRLVAMAEHMARWHRWKGDARDAERFAALAEVTARDLAQSPFARAILERSLAILDGTDGEDYVATIGDPELREEIRHRFFALRDKPTGRDLARLDLAEAALLSLDREIEALPGHLRPRNEDRLAVGFELAATIADRLLGETSEAEAQTATEAVLGRLGAATEIDDPTARRIVAQVLASLFAFLQSVCVGCPVRCIDRPRKNFAREFVAGDHPAFGAPRR